MELGQGGQSARVTLLFPSVSWDFTFIPFSLAVLKMFSEAYAPNQLRVGRPAVNDSCYFTPLPARSSSFACVWKISDITGNVHCSSCDCSVCRSHGLCGHRMSNLKLVEQYHSRGLYGHQMSDLKLMDHFWTRRILLPCKQLLQLIFLAHKWFAFLMWQVAQQSLSSVCCAFGAP